VPRRAFLSREGCQNDGRGTTLVTRSRALSATFALCLLMGMGATPARAAASGNAPPQFLRFSVENGLSQNTVPAILRDRSGFLWVGTEEGLNRYDGYTFTVFKRQEGRSDTLPDNIVTALCEDSQGRLWVGTRVGVSLYDPRSETFRQVLQTPIDVRGVVEGEGGSLWVGTLGDGLYELGADGAVRAHYIKDTEGGLGHNRILSVFKDHLGLLWVGTSQGTLDAFDTRTKRFARYRHDPKDPASLPSDAINAIAEDERGDIWIGTQASGVAVLDRTKGRFRHHRGDGGGLRADLVLSLTRDAAGMMWLGTGSGLRRHRPEGDTFVAYHHDPDNSSTLSSDVIRSVYSDRQGNLWAGTYSEGLNLLRRERPGFLRYVHDPANPESLLDDSALSFLETKDGVVWVGTENGGVHRFDPQTGRLARYRNGHAATLCLHEDAKRRLWVGTYAAGLSLFDPHQGAFTPYVIGGALENDIVWDIDEDAEGVLWLATDNGLVRLDTAAREVARFRDDPAQADDVGNNFVRTLFRDREGTLWMGTLGGLASRRGGRFTHYRHDPARPDSLPHDTVRSVLQDRQGRYWVGTAGAGLTRFDPQTGAFRSYDRRDGLPSSVVHGMLEDDGGRLWLSTNRGLCRFDTRTAAALDFDPTVGLPGRTFTQGAPLRTRDGMMLFGTTKGFYYFDPKTTVPSPDVPRLVVTAVTVEGVPKTLDAPLAALEEIALSYRESVFALEFAVLDFTFPRRNLYAYRLDGAKDWVSLGTRRDLTFTHLAPGTHTLHIKGSNSDGVWDEKGIVLRLSIAPPFWATWWWRIASAVLLVGLVLGAHRLRARRLEASERELKARVDEALSRVKTLKGLVPICAHCKKVRDDRGYWNAIDSYLRENSDAEVSHDRCPECVARDADPGALPPAALLLLVALLLPSAASAADARVAPASARFVRLGSEQGLSNDNVNAVYQDRAGFVWLATEEGLSRYDGYAFTVFEHERGNDRTLPDNYMAGVYEDRAGRLLVATAAGVCEFDRKTETFARVLDTGSTAMLEDRQGALWVASRTEGLYRLDPARTTRTHYRHDPTDATSLSSNNAVALHEDTKGTLWIATYDGGLNRLDARASAFRRYRHDPRRPDSLGHDQVWGVAEDAAGRLWAATSAGVSVLEPERDTFRHYVFRLEEGTGAPLVATSVQRDRAGTMWVGTDGGGLYHHRPDTDSFVVYRSDPGGTETLGGNVLRTVYEDRQGNLWMGHFNRGVSLLRQRQDPFVHYRHRANDPTSLSAKIVKAFHEAPGGRVFLGTDPGGLHLFDPKQGTFARQGAMDRSVMAIRRDRRGRLLVATYGSGLLQFDPARGSFQTVWRSGAPEGRNSADQVWDVHEDEGGTLWLATDGGIVQIPPHGSIVHDRVPDSDPRAADRNSVRMFLRDRQGDLWIATLAGLHRRARDGMRTQYTHDPQDPGSLSHDWATSLYEDARGRLWIATFGGGLNRWDAEKRRFVAYRTRHGLPSDVVQSILEDDTGALWLSTNRGLCRFDPETEAARSFGLTHGLHTLQFSPAAALEAQDGRLLFGSNDGLYSFRPTDVVAAPAESATPVVLTSLRVVGATRPRSLLDLTEVRLAHHEHSFSLEFTVLDFTRPRHTTYAYRLAGASDPWTPLGTQRDVTFSRLPPGAYTFVVKAANSDRAAEDAGTSLRIVIDPPFWATWWWRLGVVAALVLALGALHRARMRRLEAREREWKAHVDEALSRVKVLRGVLPICPSCKKVKDDRGYWEWVESYVKDRSEADFSHSICPPCLALLYPDYVRDTASTKRDMV
jgi:ligand-binding sensor domain-containing protein